MMTRRQLIAAMAAWSAAGCSRTGSAEPDPAPEPPPEPAPRRRPEGAAGRGRARGLRRLEDRVDGVERSAALFVPDDHDPDHAAPLLVGIHGANQRPGTMYDEFGWREACAERGWLGVFPKVGAAEDGNGDNRYLLKLIERVSSEHNVDASRIYAVGFSGGCRKAYRLAAEHRAKLSAIAVSGGVISYEGEKAQQPGTYGGPPLSIAHVHGARDARVPLDGGEHENRDGRTRRMEPTRTALRRWIEHMGMEAASTDRRPDGVPSRVDFDRWRDADSGHAVWLLVDPELDHGWAKSWATPVLARFLAKAPPR